MSDLAQIPTTQEAQEKCNRNIAAHVERRYKEMLLAIQEFLIANPNGGYYKRHSRHPLIFDSIEVVNRVMALVIPQLQAKGWYIWYRERTTTILISNQPINTWWKRFKLDWWR